MNFKLLFSSVILLFSPLSCEQDESGKLVGETENIDWAYAEKAWANLPTILENIKAPVFKDQTFFILDFGAIGDGETKNTVAFKEAIDACASAGGGKIIIPKGVFFTGAIHLKSNIHVHLEEGAILSFSTDEADYMPLVQTHWEGMEIMNFSAPIFASNCENIAITGKGLIEGNASWDNWWEWSEKEWHKLPKNRPRLMEMNRKGVPVEERKFGAGYHLRPNFIQFYKCKNILLQDFTIQHSPMWNIHTILSENITVDGIKVNAPYESPNTDALDFESSKNILVENCTFDVGDDCITIKSGRNQDGRRINTATENLIARNCYIKNGRGGIVMGSEITGGARNIYMENCKMDSPNLNRAVRIKSSEVRGGLIEDVFVRDIEIGRVGGPILNIDLHYGVREAERTGELFIPRCRNVFLENISCEAADHAWYIDGYQQEPVRNVFMRAISIKKVSNPIVQKHLNNFSLENVRVGLSKEDVKKIKN